MAPPFPVPDTLISDDLVERFARMESHFARMESHFARMESQNSSIIDKDALKALEHSVFLLETGKKIALGFCFFIHPRIAVTVAHKLSQDQQHIHCC